MNRWEVVSYSAVFVFVLVMLLYEQSIVLILGTVLITTLIAFTIRVIHPMAWETRMDRMETFLRKNQHTPYIYIYYVIANRLDEEVEITMEQLLSKYPKKKTQAVYNAAYGYYRNDMLTLRNAVNNMPKSDYRTYYETILLVENGWSEKARELLQTIKKPWMRSILLAGIELKAGNREIAIVHAHEAIDAVKGVQRYVLIKEYERSYTDDTSVFDTRMSYSHRQPVHPSRTLK
ncbi:hypothetical protein C0Q44_17495 [Paenibacillus sp. PCH8]|uniref:hypothetical protein n=1 Tax=Paenibacillus sp. PCH8 TaxID=2066524 RepID=UPI000CF93E45|nr:hypothetical protein [Paenibacillus sp. PCH8]PQP81517.1 hypothetical protein C0Q44_17495 [Paenibacillus sp. PCH8]